MSQKTRLLDHLNSGKTINRLTALVDLGIFELSARIIDLERSGFTINRKKTKITNRWGEPINVTVYWKE
jgi:hypothetical protein